MSSVGKKSVEQLELSYNLEICLAVSTEVEHINTVLILLLGYICLTPSPNIQLLKEMHANTHHQRHV